MKRHVDEKGWQPIIKIHKVNAVKEPIHIDDLGTDVLNTVFSFLPVFSLVSCRFVCHKWGEISRRVNPHFKWDFDFISVVAFQGYLELLKWGIKNRWRMTREACISAARGGQLECLKLLRQNRCPWDEYTSLEASRTGNLELLKWVIANGCNWHSVTSNVLAIEGDLKTLKWAMDHGCKWNDNTYNRAAIYGKLEILKYGMSHS